MNINRRHYKMTPTLFVNLDVKTTTIMHSQAGERVRGLSQHDSLHIKWQTVQGPRHLNTPDHMKIYYVIYQYYTMLSQDFKQELVCTNIMLTACTCVDCTLLMLGTIMKYIQVLLYCSFLIPTFDYFFMHSYS